LNLARAVVVEFRVRTRGSALPSSSPQS
jgi:hypothetical protein